METQQPQLSPFDAQCCVCVRQSIDEPGMTAGIPIVAYWTIPWHWSPVPGSGLPVSQRLQSPVWLLLWFLGGAPCAHQQQLEPVSLLVLQTHSDLDALGAPWGCYELQTDHSEQHLHKSPSARLR